MASVGAVLDGIVHQVDQHLLDAQRVEACRDRRGSVDDERVRACAAATPRRAVVAYNVVTAQSLCHEGGNRGASIISR